MKKTVIPFIIICITLFSCEEEFDLKLENSEPKLTVTGVVTDGEGPHFVKLTKSAGFNVDSFEHGYRGFDIINDATVIISDNAGNIDTLIPTPVDFCWWEIWDENYIYVIDSVYAECDGGDRAKRGSYQTQNLTGVPGRTYYLDIYTPDGKHYEAESYMPAKVELDSLSYILNHIYYQGSIWKKQFIPLVYFKEPKNEKNYYFFTDRNICRFAGYSNYFILSDEFLSDYVSGLNIGIKFHNLVFNISYEDTIVYVPNDIKMASINEDTYYYIKSLQEQINNGTHSPSPANPPGNLSGEALGYFMACPVKEYKLIPKESDMNR